MNVRYKKFFVAFLFIALILFIVWMGFNMNKEYFTEDNGSIPKIIHQTAPVDKSKWHELWFECQQSWFDTFPQPEYQYKMWTDEDLDDLIKNDFPWFYEKYTNYDKNIKRIDMARYFILYKHGGIYADMDYMCMKNFYHLLTPNKVTISESPYANEYLQNALMASNKENPFWMKVIEEVKKRPDHLSIVDLTGPRMLSYVYYENPNEVVPLKMELFNPMVDTPGFDSNDVYTKQFSTCSWC
jgi:mannosyltransferase OCH1-like enzyme